MCNCTKTADIGIRLIHPLAKMPVKATAEASGYDLYATEECLLLPGDFRGVGTGLVLVLPDNYEAQVRPRSGLAIK